MNKLLFLDVDGVLNDRHIIAWSHQKSKKDNEAGFGDDILADKGRMGRMGRMIHVPYVKLVNHVVDTAGAKIVLSSTWRMFFKTLEDANTFFKDMSLREIVGMTPRGYPGMKFSQSPRRGLEIQRYIDSLDTKVDSLVILDDDSDMEHLRHRLVQTKGFTNEPVGITKADAEAAIKMFEVHDTAHLNYNWNKGE